MIYPEREFMPITKRVTQDLSETIADPEKETPNQPNCSREVKEETNMKILTATPTLPDEQEGGFPLTRPDRVRSQPAYLVDGPEG